VTLEEMKNLPEAQQEELFKHLSGIRKKAKVVTYSATYGVGKVKLARSTGMSEDDAARLLRAFWELNWSVQKVAKDSIVRRIGGQMWIYNPVSRFWISLRYEKDSFSSLNQSTGVFCFDSWLAHCWAKGLRGIGQFHDEVITLSDDDDWTYQTMKTAIAEVNDKLQLNVPLDVDPKFGTNYAQVH
jgi:DNA polymerase I-like protein with 3'-5' exonuclease and polymerase domains